LMQQPGRFDPTHCRQVPHRLCFSANEHRA
jgi:hypothetical protein